MDSVFQDQSALIDFLRAGEALENIGYWYYDLTNHKMVCSDLTREILELEEFHTAKPRNT